MAIQNFFTSRDNNLDGNTYVGQLGRLWYNPDTNSIYASDGSTVGGIPVDLATGANITANNITANSITSTDGTLEVIGNLSISGNISPAAVGKIGGITPGPGANVSNTGLLTIDTTGLPLSFGNFTANNNILTIVNSDEDMILATSGDAEIQLVGNIGFYKSNGLPPNVDNRYFRAADDGQLTILVPASDPIAGGVEIIGSATGNFIQPGAPGAMLHLTGNPEIPCRLYIDGNDDYASIVGRRWGGNVAVPTQVLAGEYVLRINATGATDAGVGNVALAQIQFQALEDQTTTAQGSALNFIVTPIGEPAANRVEAANITVANGVSAIKFVTSGTVEATGNISGGNLILSSGGIISSTGLISTTGNVSAGNIDVTGAVAVTGNISAGNVNSYVNLPAGSATKAPLVFTSGSITTAPIAGGMNYDGRVFYATPQSNERGLMVTEQLYVVNADYNIVDQTALQSLLGVSATLSSATRYGYRITATVYKTANNIALQYALGGTVTLARHTYETLTTAAAGLGTLTSPSVVREVLTTNFGTAVTVTASLNGAGYYSLSVQGILNVTTGGTWFPEIGFTGLPGAGSLVTGGSKIEIWPIGATGANVAIGNWT